MSMLNGKNIKVFISQDQLKSRIAELGKMITAEYAHLTEPLVIVTVLKGSVIFMADLCREIDWPTKIEFIGVSSYGDATFSSGVVQITQDLTRPIKDMHVLVVEDIVETGLTTRYLLDNLATRGPASVKLCSLLEKPNKNNGNTKIDFLGFSIADDFVVGYGLDLAEVYRNLPFVGIMQNS